METRKSSHNDALRRAKKALLPLIPRGTKIKWDLRPKLPGNIWGCTWRSGKNTWTIQVETSGGYAITLDTCLHEVAHVLVGDVREREGPHGPLWGVRYAECWRAVYEKRSSRANTRKS